MSKGLQSYVEPLRMEIARRRSKVQTRGCGYWGAVAYLNKKGILTKKQISPTTAGIVNEIVEATILQDSLMKQEDKHGSRRRTKFRKTGPPVSSLNERSKQALATFRT